MFKIESVFREVLSNQVKSSKKGKNKDEGKLQKISITSELMRYITTIQMAGAKIEDVLSNISYIGPLRKRPRRYYETSNEKPRSVGTRGQFAPEMIFTCDDRKLIARVNY